MSIFAVHFDELENLPYARSRRTFLRVFSPYYLDNGQYDFDYYVMLCIEILLCVYVCVCVFDK